MRQTTVWLLRHGALLLPAQKCFVGQQNKLLSVQGERQALFWGRYFAHIPLQGIICSDLQRCVATAHIVQHAFTTHVAVQQEVGFREISLGLWEDMPVKEVQTRFPKEYAARGKCIDTFRPPQGESFTDLAQRVLPTFFYYVEQFAGGHVLIVAHAGVNRVILSHIMALPLKDVLRMPQPYACCTQVVVPVS